VIVYVRNTTCRINILGRKKRISIFIRKEHVIGNPGQAGKYGVILLNHC
jgi:hypothetical protein